MRILLLAIGMLMFTPHISFSQPISLEDEVRFTVDPMVLINEGNLDIKVEYETGTYGNNNHRIIVMLEYLSGHEYIGGSLGYGYTIPYRIGEIYFQIQPSFDLGFVIRYGWLDAFGINHAWGLRHSIKITESINIYIHNRLIYRSDLHYADEMSLTPENIPFYNIDNAIGISIKLN